MIEYVEESTVEGVAHVKVPQVELSNYLHVMQFSNSNFSLLRSNPGLTYDQLLLI
jgi:hypothetical protein